MKQAYEILDEFSEREMLPMNQMPAEILEHLPLVRQWWCGEPTVKGSS
ncbi:MAG: hypothetical protein OXO49_02365 [Gammaproteobacteria bacterium]|nr:hypothetical protein [Gammaproteobacteria bacterium]MDE0251347.1 hypothetical protein [Gammaproteobacteria bacterium]MDE0401969.1 hypothetical protein [Gammaproteobacteria bacterium]